MIDTKIGTFPINFVDMLTGEKVGALAVIYSLILILICVNQNMANN